MQAAGRILRDDGRLPPQFLFGEDGETWMSLGFGGPPSRDEKGLMLANALFAHLKVDRFVFLSQVWLASYTDEQATPGAGFVTPAERADRREVVIAHLVEQHPASPPSPVLRLIERDHAGRPSLGRDIGLEGVLDLPASFREILDPARADPRLAAIVEQLLGRRLRRLSRVPLGVHVH